QFVQIIISSFSTILRLDNLTDYTPPSNSRAAPQTYSSGVQRPQTTSTAYRQPTSQPASRQTASSYGAPRNQQPQQMTPQQVAQVNNSVENIRKNTEQ